MPQHAPAQAAGAAGDPSLDALLASPLLKAALAPPPPPATGLIGAHRPGAPAGSGSSFTSAKGYAAWAAAASPTAADAAAQQAPAAAPRSRLLALCPTVPPAMQRSEWCLDDYQVLEKLYTGYASKVYKAMCRRTREVVVLKSYQLSAICELYQHQIFREVGLHASLTHENVVALYAAFQEGDFVIMVQEFADGGDLFSLLQKYGGRLHERAAVSLVLEPFLRVLQYLHTRGIVHRDIKPENILFTSAMCLKLADFGLAINLRQERAVTRAGTLDYMAPEVLKCPYKNHPDENKEKTHLHYGGTVDSWAVGVLAYELLVGCPPFYEQTKDKVEARIKASAPSFPRTMSDDARAFIGAALTKDPVARPAVLQLLMHPWVDALRARRSMRQLAAPAVPAACARVAPAVGPTPAPAAAAAALPAQAAAILAALRPGGSPAAHGAGAGAGAGSQSPRVQSPRQLPAAAAAYAAAAPADAARRKVALLVPMTSLRAATAAPAAPAPPSAHAPGCPASLSPRGAREAAGSPSLSPRSAAADAAHDSCILGSHRPLKLSSSLAAKKPPPPPSAFSSGARRSPAASPPPPSPRAGGYAARAAPAGGAARGALASAKSSPLLVAGDLRSRDLRSLGLRGAGAAPLGGGGGGEATGEARRREWLQGVRMWPN